MENTDRQIEARARDASQKRRSKIGDKTIAKASAELPGQMTPEIKAHGLNLSLKHTTRAPSPKKQ